MVIASSNDGCGSLAYQRDRPASYGGSSAYIGVCVQINAADGGRWLAAIKMARSGN